MKYNKLIDRLNIEAETENSEEYLQLAKEAYDRNRLNLLANFYLADANLRNGYYLQSLICFNQMMELQRIYEESIIDEALLEEQIRILQNRISEQIPDMSEEEREECSLVLRALVSEDHMLSVGYFEEGFFLEKYYGEHYYKIDFKLQPVFFGKYYDHFRSYGGGNAQTGVLLGKIEGWKTDVRGYEFKMQSEPDKTYSMYTLPGNADDTYVFPIVINPEKDDTNVVIVDIKKTNGEEYSFFDSIHQTYSYLRLEGGSVVTCSNSFVAANPVKLEHNPERKKLVLNIFLDSFNFKVIKGEKFKELMPFTAAFFEKGTVFENYYTGSEFTYPSVASYYTGMTSSHHQVLNQNVHFPIKENHRMLSEVFHDRGYLTSKIGGNYSVSPQYGYFRGIDRFVYEKAEQHFHAEEAVSEAIEQMEGFSETDQFIWMEIQDLHEVAGYWQMRLSSQAKLSAQLREVDNEGGSSLYQTPSVHRRMVYEEQLRRVDSKLRALYEYIVEHYEKEEVIVTLISDHGNGFNVDAGEKFMSPDRTNVPLMVYGGEKENEKCDELISIFDYGHILCHLAGITEDKWLEQGDGHLPKYYGGEGREYIFSQSLFPDRHYNATILTEDFQYFIESKTDVKNDCTIDLTDAEQILRNWNRESIDDEEKMKKFHQMIKGELGDFLIG